MKSLALEAVGCGPNTCPGNLAACTEHLCAHVFAMSESTDALGSRKDIKQLHFNDANESMISSAQLSHTLEEFVSDRQRTGANAL